MRGQILGVDKVSGEGQISGEDGLRYAFKPEEWSDAKAPAIGVKVDFAAEGARAARIFRLPEASGTIALGDPPAVRREGKSRIAAAVLAFFLGMLGVHKFYLGKRGAGLTMLLCGTIGWLLVVPGIFASLTALIECVIYLLSSDEEFDRKYVRGNKSWF